MPKKGGDEEYELVPVSPFKRLEREIEELKSKKQVDVPVEKLGDNIERLNEQVSKLVIVNINLQAKITELLIKDTELIENVTEMVQLLKRASEVEASPEKTELKINLEPVINELRMLNSQNRMVIDGFSKLNDYLLKSNRREMLGRVVQAPPPPAREM